MTKASGSSPEMVTLKVASQRLGGVLSVLALRRLVRAGEVRGGRVGLKEIGLTVPFDADGLESVANLHEVEIDDEAPTKEFPCDVVATLMRT